MRIVADDVFAATSARIAQAVERLPTGVEDPDPPIITAIEAALAAERRSWAAFEYRSTAAVRPRGLHVLTAAAAPPRIHASSGIDSFPVHDSSITVIARSPECGRAVRLCLVSRVRAVRGPARGRGRALFVRARTGAGASVPFAAAGGGVPPHHRVCAAVRRRPGVDQVRARTDVRHGRALASRFDAFGETVIGPMSGVGRTDGLDLSETVGAYFDRAARPAFSTSPCRTWRTRPWPLATSGEHVVRGYRAAGRLERRGASIGWSPSCWLDFGTDSGERGRSTSRAWRHACSAAPAGSPSTAWLARQACHASISRGSSAQRIGMGPKLYCRLARFHSVLAHASTRATIDWARVAVDMGFADQSHLIAECREFSGLTPHTLAARDWFHPFIERAKSGSRR